MASWNSSGDPESGRLSESQSANLGGTEVLQRIGSFFGFLCSHCLKQSTLFSGDSRNAAA